jgi:predicted nucleic acid-binding Zn ribbon protein
MEISIFTKVETDTLVLNCSEVLFVQRKRRKQFMIILKKFEMLSEITKFTIKEVLECFQ